MIQRTSYEDNGGLVAFLNTITQGLYGLREGKKTCSGGGKKAPARGFLGGSPFPLEEARRWSIPRLVGGLKA